MIPYASNLFRFIAIFLLLTTNFSQAKSDENKHNQLIVLFHGFANNVASLKTIQTKLEQAFPCATVVALANVEKMQSLNLSIQEQVEVSFKELNQKVADLGNKSIVFIGHSQGGVRAYALLKQYAHLLQVKGLVTLATPWEGSPGGRVNEKMLLEHLTDPVLNDLRMLSLSLGYPADTLTEQLKLEIKNHQSILHFPGAKDLLVDSTFLCEIKKTLPHTKVPILAIGGGQDDFRALVPKKIPHSFKALNSMYTWLIVGEAKCNRSHDMYIPLYSQLALNIVPKNKKNFKRIFIKDVFHSRKVWTIVTVPPYRNILSNPRVLHAIIKFTKKALTQI
ncbi:esterase/lipase family protein [Candidatus Cardinium hertigii]|jgi:pimeloyl-ACP methyl ester carboxylesterase|uniref:Alpha/beta hydrolase n=1 Tax=Candidatus Cardinium hertigii TaxID=247481 RepID=A0A3N2QC84_9BACT|nr:alpha/beta hydrolase [Candidatus Cardinium hertigii]ROT47396.1 alpha/beta hydrolase [Candidatus Cardinium hertigii]